MWLSEGLYVYLYVSGSGCRLSLSMGLSKVSAMMTAFWAATVFLMWTVFSFSCHWYAKRFLHESGPDRDEG